MAGIEEDDDPRDYQTFIMTHVSSMQSKYSESRLILSLVNVISRLM
jgi:hypothetical protein